jgi:Pyruvate kinase, barrel domain
LTDEDLEALPFVVKNADIVGYSFVRRETDVRELEARLAELGGEKLGIILKIETREGFDQLPRLLLAAMQSRAVAVMIARGGLSGRMRLPAARRGAGRNPLDLRGGPYAGDLGNAGAGVAGENGNSLAVGNHGCGDGGARGVRHAQQGSVYRLRPCTFSTTFCDACRLTRRRSVDVAKASSGRRFSRWRMSASRT